MATVTDTVVHRRPALEEETPSNDETKSQPAKENSGPKKKSRRPPRNKWLQQQIPACRPVFTAKYVFGLFMIVGIIFLALGIIFVVVTARLRDLEVEYTDCTPVDDYIQDSGCESYLRNLSNLTSTRRSSVEDCHCSLNFEVEKTIRYPWKFYYAMDNYYQNHRRYLNSWDPAQLRGDNFDEPTDNCRPLVRDTQDGRRRPIAPCGIIANSWFNDSFYYLVNEDRNETIELDSNNIAWKTDRDVRFKNPSNLDEELRGVNRPPNWPKNLSMIEDGLENESLIVWYRVSAFPWFRKLYAHPEENKDLPAGNYSIFITYNYPVGNFNGKKYIVFSELSWLGGRNLFLGIAYIITAIVCMITSIILLIIHLFFSKWKTKDPNFLKRSY